MSRTVKNGIDYIRNFLGELDSGKLKEAGLIESFNLAKDRVQGDTMDIAFKQYQKTAFLSGAVVQVPSDMLVAPNSIIDVLTSNGVKASYTKNYTTPTADITYTAVTPGTGGNSIVLTLDGTAVSVPTVSVAFSAGAVNISVDFNSGVDTCNEIIAAVNAHPIASLYVVASTTTGSALPVPSSGTGVNLSGGTGSGFTPCDELSIEDFSRTQNNTYQVGSLTQPFYTRTGGTAADQILKFYPATIEFVQLIYKYRLADVSATTDTLTVPNEYIDLLYKDVLTRCYMQLKAQADSQQEAVEYEKKAMELEQGYTKSLQTEVLEKRRMKSNDND